MRHQGVLLDPTGVGSRPIARNAEQVETRKCPRTFVFMALFDPQKIDVNDLRAIKRGELAVMLDLAAMKAAGYPLFVSPASAKFITLQTNCKVNGVQLPGIGPEFILGAYDMARHVFVETPTRGGYNSWFRGGDLYPSHLGRPPARP